MIQFLVGVGIGVFITVSFSPIHENFGLERTRHLDSLDVHLVRDADLYTKPQLIRMYLETKQKLDSIQHENVKKSLQK